MNICVSLYFKYSLPLPTKNILDETWHYWTQPTFYFCFRQSFIKLPPDQLYEDLFDGPDMKQCEKNLFDDLKSEGCDMTDPKMNVAVTDYVSDRLVYI